MASEGKLAGSGKNGGIARANRGVRGILGDENVCYNVLMTNRALLFISILLVMLMLLIMNFTTPTEIGPLGVLVFFTILYVATFGVFAVLTGTFFKLKGKRKTGRKERFYAAIISFMPIILLLMQSFGGISILSVVMILIFEFLGCFLVYKVV